MLETDELFLLLNHAEEKFTMKQCELLMQAMDKDCSGTISFAEFVDFIFSDGGSPQKEASVMRKCLIGDNNAADLQECLLSKSRPSQAIQISGAPETLAANGRYEKVEHDWVVYAASGADQHEGQALNGHPCWKLSGKRSKHHLFYGWSADGRLQGWFISKALPAEGLPVEDYLLFNPSPLAASPDQCCATWQTSDGKRPKTLVAEPATGSDVIVEDLETDHLIEEDLWDAVELAEDGLDEAVEGEGAGHDEDFDWEQEWVEECGEFEDESSDEDEWGPLPSRNSEIVASRTSTGSTVAVQKSESAVSARVSARTSEMRKRSTGSRRRSSAVPMLQVQQVAPGFKVVRRRSEMPDPNKVKPRASTRSASKGKSQKELAKEAEDAKKAKRAASENKDEEEEDITKYQDGCHLDPDFLPCKKALGKLSAKVKVDGWMRLSKLHETPCLFRRVVPDNVIANHTAGNFWFSSACAAVAEYPAWIQSMFGRTTEINPNGKYQVRLYHPGRKEFVRVAIDDYVPVYKRAPVFCGITGDGEIWPALVEKAFAKFCRCYGNIEWGQCWYGLLYLCGGGFASCWQRQPKMLVRTSVWLRSRTVWKGENNSVIDRDIGEGIVEDENGRDPDHLWRALRKYMELCYPVTCEVDPDVEEKGLIPDRSYSLLGAREIPVRGNRAMRMVFLRNPFGVGEWTGRWSDEDEVWEPNTDVQFALGMEPGDDGAFWMSFHDFLAHFRKISVVKKSLPAQGCNPTKLMGLKRGLGLATET